MIVWPGLRRSVSAIRRLFNSASFDAPLTHSAIPTRAASGTTATFTRATTKTVTNNDGYLVTLLAGEIGFPGARRVRNLLPSSESFATGWQAPGASSVSANAILSPIGTLTADALIEDGTTAYHRINHASVSRTSGQVIAVSVYAKYAGRNLFMNWSSFCNATGAFDLQTGAVTQGVGVASIEALDDGWYRCTVIGTCTVTGAENGYLQLTPTNVSGSYAGDGTSGAYFWGAQLEDVTAQTTQTAGEYVSVGVESAPYYHGSFVDGVKCFPTDLSGNPLTTMERYKPEAAATQIIAATADIRDMTGVNWVLGATMTRARTSVGADGAANSANRLTGGAVAATNTILYTVTAAASSRTYSALVKRVTGTGPVRIIQTGTETDISSQLNTAGYALVQLNASVLNVAIGFKIDTNGDAIDVDMNQFEAGTFATSRILTGGGVRNADVLTYTGGDIPNLKTLCVTFRRESGAASVGVVVTHGDGTSNERAYADMASATALQFAGYDGGVLQWDTTASNAYVPGTVAKLAFSQATNDLKMAFNGVAQTADTSATMPTNTQLQVGHVNGAFQLSGNVGGIYGWTRNFSQSELNAITAL